MQFVLVGLERLHVDFRSICSNREFHYSCSFTKMSSAKHLLLVFTTYYLSLKCAHLTEIQTIMKDVVKETLCSTAMSGNAIGALHSCLKESLKPANRIEAECIETLYPSISDYYTQVCNESVRVEVNSDIFKCMKDVCKAKGFDPMVDYYYCLALSHKADSDCGLLALSVPENVKYRAMVAQNVTDEHKNVERIFCRKMLNDEISDELERLKTLECIILPRKDLIRKCALLFKEKHSRVLDPEILLNIGCDRSRYSDDERWMNVCLHENEGHLLKIINEVKPFTKYYEESLHKEKAIACFEKLENSK